MESEAVTERVVPANHLAAAIDACSFPGLHFALRYDGDRPYVQASGLRPDPETDVAAVQRGRKWRLSLHMTRSEVVQTCLAAALAFVEHEARESFRYRGEAIFGPHFDVERLRDLALAKATEQRAKAT